MRKPITFLLFSCCIAGVMAQGTAADAYASAEAAYMAGSLADARIRVDEAISLDPSMAKAYKLRGDIHQRDKAYEHALADYKRSEDLDPNDVRLYVSRSALRLTDGNLKGAIKDAEKAIQLDPTSADAHNNRAWALYLSDMPDPALKDAIKAVRLQPTHAEALYLAGVIKGERYDEKEGLGDIEAALKLKPDLPGGLMSMAVLLYEAKEYEQAVLKFNQVIATDTAELTAAHFYRGHSYYELKNKVEACNDFTEAMRRGDKEATFIVRNYCNTEDAKIPRKPRKGARKITVEF